MMYGYQNFSAADQRASLKRLRSLSTLAAVILWSALNHIAIANDRAAGVPEEAKWVKVDGVVDGDTIVLMDKTRVRLHGIDTPERDQPYGKQATGALDALIETQDPR